MHITVCETPALPKPGAENGSESEPEAGLQEGFIKDSDPIGT
jgi:hypothetical protein